LSTAVAAGEKRLMMKVFGEGSSSLQPGLPCHRTILAVDIEGSTVQNNFAKVELRRVMYELVEASMIASGIAGPHRDPFVDRGDGILALIHPVDEVPKTLLLSRVIPLLDESLAEHTRRFPGRRLRLRAVVHAGEVHFDGRGWCGEALDVAFELLDAPEVKECLRQSKRSLQLVVSDHIYTSVVRQGYDGINERTFVDMGHVEVAGQRHRGWVRMGDGEAVIDVHRKRTRRLGPRWSGPDERLA
jgi:class 3 adenylate cyclase